MAWLSAISDLVGLIGGILLAIPAVFSQPIRDQREAIDASIAGDEGARRALDASAKTYNEIVIRLGRRDLNFAKLGSSALAIAFLLKLIVEIAAIHNKQPLP